MRHVEVLEAIKSIKLSLHLYLFNDQNYLELWACKIAEAKKQAKEFKLRVNERLLTKTNRNMAMNLLGQAEEEKKDPSASLNRGRTFSDDPAQGTVFQKMLS